LEICIFKISTSLFIKISKGDEVMNIYNYIEKEKEKYKSDYNLDDFKPLYRGDIGLIDDIISGKENYFIVIFTDFDCDGQSAGLIIKSMMDQFCVPYYWHISEREDGYGLKRTALDSIVSKLSINKKDEEKVVLFTADLGITNKDEVEYAYSIGFDKVIITDHHTPQEQLIPNADLVINQKFSDNIDEWVCGAGLVYMLFRNYENELTKIIAGIATIGDMVEMHYGGINRTIVKQSLKILNTTILSDRILRMFLSELIYNFGKKEITEEDFGFGVCPAINSLSRMGETTLLKEFFDFNCLNRKDKLKKIKQTNDRRKEIQAKKEKEVSNINMNDIDKNSIEIFILDDIDSSLLGLISSFILNNYGIDNICLRQLENGSYKGSGRSKKNSMYNFLQNLMEYGAIGGGHTCACGLTIPEDKIDIILNKYRNIPLIKQDTEDRNIYTVELSDIDDDLFLHIDKIKPFGNNNPPPLVRIDNVKIIKKRSVGSHVFTLCEIGDGWDKIMYDLLFFKAYDLKIKKKDEISIIGTMSRNSIIVDKVIE
jgi:single-stranded-DNA-specific exonuclease